MYVRPTSTLLLSGMLTPEILAILRSCLALALLVARVLADDQHDAAAPDHLAFLTHRLDRRPYLHGFLAITIRKGGPAGPRRRAGEPGAGSLTHRCELRPDQKMLAKTDTPTKIRWWISLKSAWRLETDPLCSGLRGLQMPWGEDPWPVARDGDRVLEMGGEGVVLGVDRPVVVAHPHRLPPDRDHRLDAEDQALLDHGAAPGL